MNLFQEKIFLNGEIFVPGLWYNALLVFDFYTGLR
jgi:hypothetical protein